jgi:hypothetical protein
MPSTIITRTRVPAPQHAEHAKKVFGARFIFLESFADETASSLSPDYAGGLWNFFALSNGGFYMAPSCGDTYRVSCANGFEGSVSADAFGITACLYAYSHLSFSPDELFAELCARNYHLLRQFALEHAEVKFILAIVD